MLANVKVTKNIVEAVFLPFIVVVGERLKESYAGVEETCTDTSAIYREVRCTASCLLR
jgi:hypothetical protein